MTEVVQDGGQEESAMVGEDEFTEGEVKFDDDEIESMVDGDSEEGKDSIEGNRASNNQTENSRRKKDKHRGFVLDVQAMVVEYICKST